MNIYVGQTITKHVVEETEIKQIRNLNFGTNYKIIDSTLKVDPYLKLRNPPFCQYNLASLNIKCNKVIKII